jgi:hypothetical protein
LRAAGTAEEFFQGAAALRDAAEAKRKLTIANDDEGGSDDE